MHCNKYVQGHHHNGDQPRSLDDLTISHIVDHTVNHLGIWLQIRVLRPVPKAAVHKECACRCVSWWGYGGEGANPGLSRNVRKRTKPAKSV